MIYPKMFRMFHVENETNREKSSFIFHRWSKIILFHFNCLSCARSTRLGNHLTTCAFNVNMHTPYRYYKWFELHFTGLWVNGEANGNVSPLHETFIVLLFGDIDEAINRYLINSCLFQIFNQFFFLVLHLSILTYLLNGRNDQNDFFLSAAVRDRGNYLTIIPHLRLVRGFGNELCASKIKLNFTFPRIKIWGYHHKSTGASWTRNRHEWKILISHLSDSTFVWRRILLLNIFSIEFVAFHHSPTIGLIYFN